MASSLNNIQNHVNYPLLGRKSLVRLAKALPLAVFFLACLILAFKALFCPIVFYFKIN